MLFDTPELEPLDHEVVERVLDARQQLRHQLARTRRWNGLLRRVTLASAIRSSNSIEGYHVSADDALAAVDVGAPVEAAEDDVAWDATNSYRRAMTYVLQLHDDPHFAYSPALIRSLHFMLVEYDLGALPGRWRPGPVFVNDTATGAIVYEGPPDEQVPGLIDELAAGLEAGAGPTLVRAAMAHLNLVMVHPCKDGNGRLARVLQSLVLAREGILAPAFCSIEEYLGRFTSDYYDVLARVGGGQWSPHRDALPWVRFCLTAHFRQAQVLLARDREMGQLYEAVDALLDTHGLPDRAAGSVVMAGLGFRIDNESYRTSTDVSAGTATRDLKLLVDAGLLATSGEKRGRTYVATNLVQQPARHASRTIAASERVDPYATEDARIDPYAQPKLL